MDKSKLQTYKTQKILKYCFYLLVTDETASIKVMVYGKPRYQKFQKGKHYLFRKLIRDKNLFKVTSQTIVAELGAFDVPKEVEEEAKRRSSHSPHVLIEEVKKWDSGIVSVEGIITEVSSSFGQMSAALLSCYMFPTGCIPTCSQVFHPYLLF